MRRWQGILPRRASLTESQKPNIVYLRRQQRQRVVFRPIFIRIGGTGVDGGSSEGSEARFAAYVEALGAVLGHADRQQPMHDYCLGLLMPIERKSVEPMAAVTAPAQVAAKHQSLLHFVGNADCAREQPAARQQAPR